MRAELGSYLYLALMQFSKLSVLSSSPSSTCELQAMFNLSRINQDGHFVIGGMYDIHSFSDPPELTFTSKLQTPSCYG